MAKKIEILNVIGDKLKEIEANTRDNEQAKSGPWLDALNKWADRAEGPQLPLRKKREF